MPAGVVQTGDDLVRRDPQLAQADMHFAYDDPHPDLGPLKADRLALQFEQTPAAVYNRSEVVRGIERVGGGRLAGMSAAQVARLEADGVIE